MKNYKDFIKNKKSISISNEEIKKVEDYTVKNDSDLDGFINFANVYNFIHYFYSINDKNIRNYKNPQNISVDKMKEKFGEPNFISDYNDSEWWFLSFKDEMFAVDINPHEGSYMFIYSNENNPYDMDLNTKVYEFWYNFFEKLEN